MARRFGDVDRVLRRKTRSDVGKKRKNYKGKPCLHRPKRRYVRHIGNKDSLWLRAFWRVPMSIDGYKNWKHNRNKVYKEVTNMKMSPTFRNVPLSEINTKDKFEDFFARNLWEGKFVIMGGSHGKTKTHFKNVAIATISVKNTDEGNVARITKNTRLSRYKWFYKG